MISIFKVKELKRVNDFHIILYSYSMYNMYINMCTYMCMYVYNKCICASVCLYLYMCVCHAFTYPFPYSVYLRVPLKDK